MTDIGKGLACIAIMGACAYVSIDSKNAFEIISSGIFGCIAIWIFG